MLSKKVKKRFKKMVILKSTQRVDSKSLFHPIIIILHVW
jgi:hypothetical protein